jgi:hypothetical protein
MVLHQMLVEMLDRKTLVALAIKPLHFFRPVDRNPPPRRLAEPPVEKPGRAVPVIAVTPAPERPLAHPNRSAASAWFSSADSQRLRRFKNIAMRTP